MSTVTSEVLEIEEKEEEETTEEVFDPEKVEFEFEKDFLVASFSIGDSVTFVTSYRQVDTDEDGNVIQETEKKVKVTKTIKEVELQIDKIVEKLEKDPNSVVFWRMHGEDINMQRDLLLKLLRNNDASRKMADDLQYKLFSFFLLIMNHHGMDFKIRTRMLRLVGVGISKKAVISEGYKATTFSKDAKLSKIGRGMKGVRLVFSQGFNGEYPWNEHTQKRSHPLPKHVSLDFVREIGGDNKCTIVRKWKDGDKKITDDLDLTGYSFYEDFNAEKSKKKDSFWSLRSSLFASLEQNASTGLLARLILVKEDKQIDVSFYQTLGTFKTVRSFLEKGGLIETKRPKSRKKIQSRGPDNQTPQWLAEEIERKKREKGKISKKFDIAKYQEPFEKSKKLDYENMTSRKQDSFNSFFEECSTSSEDVVMDDILFAHNFFKNFNNLLAFFPKARSELKKIAFEIVFYPMLQRKHFWLKSYYFWNADDFQEWAKGTFEFLDDTFSSMLVLSDCIPSFHDLLKESVDFSMDDFDQKLPYSVFLSKWETGGFPNSAEFLFGKGLFKEPVNATQLRKYRLKPKKIFGLASLRYTNFLKKAQELKNLAKGTNFGKMKKSIKDLLKPLILQEQDTRHSILRLCLEDLYSRISKNEFLNDNIKLQQGIKETVKEINSKYTKKFYSSLNDFSNLQKMCQTISFKKEDPKNVWSPDNDEILNYEVKLCFSSQNRTIAKGHKIGYKVLQTTNTCDAPFAFFHLGVMVGNTFFDWYNTGFVVGKKTAGSNIIASIDLDMIEIKIKDMMKIAEFIFQWNLKKEYDNFKCNCQNFAEDFVGFLYSEFAHKENSMDYLLKNDNACKKWIDVMKFKKDPVAKINVTKKFKERMDIILPKGTIELYLKEEGWKVLKFSDHQSVYEFMQNFNTQDKYDALYKEFPDVLIMLKAFCRGSISSERNKKDFDPSKKDIKCCYFYTRGREKMNRFKIKLVSINITLIKDLVLVN